jgi:hypothetical protein
MMMAGLPDIIACVPTTHYDGNDEPYIIGLFVGFETKTSSGHDPSAIQRQVHSNIRFARGAVYVVRSVQDALEALADLGWQPPTP